MKYGCIGEHLGHSFSLEIHRALGDYPYELKELYPKDVGAFLQSHDFLGINVTIPYKETVIPYLDALDESAKKVGAVNTVVNRDGKLIGYNTDVFGMKTLLSYANICLQGKTVAILGTGGTSKCAFAVCQDLGAKAIYKVSRSKTGEGVISYPALYEMARDVDVIINTTPVGMFPNEHTSPLKLDCFPHLSGVVDAIYHPLRTQLVTQANALNIPAVGGLFMLVSQGAMASEIFFDDPTYLEKIPSVYEKVMLEKENIVLIGMPGVGKSTLGKSVSEKLGKPFYDSDLEIEKKVGMSASQYLSSVGEAQFRKTESAVIFDLSQKCGIVLACGGGAVLKEENVKALKQNGKLFYLSRPLSQLHQTQLRPLTPTPEALEKIYCERRPLYEAAADVTVLLSDDKSTAQSQLQKAILERNV